MRKITTTPMTTTQRLTALFNRVERQLTLTPPEKVALDRLRKHLAKRAAAYAAAEAK